jgi:hypothetical protein
LSQGEKWEKYPLCNHTPFIMKSDIEFCNSFSLDFRFLLWRELDPARENSTSLHAYCMHFVRKRQA